VTGPPPGGNSTAANFLAQAADLRALSLNWGSWFMLAAIVAHENVHAARLLPALQHATVVPPLRAAIEALTVPDTGQGEAAAIAALMALPAFRAAEVAALAAWDARYVVLIAGDHGMGAGTSYAAERAVVIPMRTRICAHAAGPAGWGACPP
jgi:hypothetical protein